MIVELLDLNGNVCLRKRVRNRFPATVTLPKACDEQVAISGVRLLSTAVTTLYVNGKPVREHRETFTTPVALTGGDGIQLQNPADGMGKPERRRENGR